jgi:Protein of unknown function (DUF4236)
MGLRFQRRVRLFPGARINFSKSGASISVGRKGLGWITGGGPRGTRITVDVLPGSGIYYTEKLPPPPPSPVRNRVARAIVVILIAITAVWLFHT